MNDYSLSHLSAPALRHELKAAIARERGCTAEVLAHIAEFEARALFAEDGHSSMFAYCVDELGLSEDAALKRIRAARSAREFPAILSMVADGRLHLTAVLVVGPHLTRENADELLAAVAHKSRTRIERFLAERFPTADLPTLIRPIPPPAPSPPAPVAPPLETEPSGSGQVAPGPLMSSHLIHNELPVPASRVKPLAPRRFGVQFTMDDDTHENLLYAQALLGRRVRSGDVAAVFALALKALIPQLEKQKFAATRRPRHQQNRSSADPRHIAAAVKRAVWERDGGRCAFVSDSGRRCEERADLEFDHVEPVARGGASTAQNLRLLCRTHNQHAAERVFGAGFMEERREAARRAGRSGTRNPSRPRAGVPMVESPEERAARARLAAEARAEIEAVLAG